MKPQLPNASVAVITRTKDRPNFVRRAMESVLSQTYGDWIHLIVNDGGGQAPLEALGRAFKDRYKGRLCIIHHETSQGMQDASNAGLDASSSEFVTIHDDDDSWEPEFLAKTISALREGEPRRKIDGAVSQSTRIFEEITLGGTIKELKRSNYYYFEFANLNEMRRRNLFPPIAFVYRRKVHEKIGKFNQEYDVLGDHDFNLRFLRYFNITVIREYLANYHWRMHAQGNTVTRGVDKHRSMLSRLKNDYLREWLSGSPDAVGDLDAVPFPPAFGDPSAPFRKREREATAPAAFPSPSTGDDFKCLSVDVFDTALLRQCNLPTDVFKIVEKQIPSRLGKNETPPFSLARALAEENARVCHQRDVTLDEIYEECGKILGITRREADQLKALELAVEESLLYPHPKTLALAKEAQAQGKTVIYISDMYLSAKCIRKWLMNAGYPKGEIFVSCELGKTKHQGDLFLEVLRKLPFQATEVLHIGDNLQSDFVQARKHGFRSLHLSPESTTTPWCEEVEPYADDSEEAWSSILAGLVRRRHQEGGFTDDSLLFRLGYELAGPMYLSYMRWVCQHAKENGIKRLLLMGRDGYYLEKTLNLCGDQLTKGIRFTYIEASRKTLSFASFDGLDRSAIEFLSTPHPALSASDFLTRLGLEWRDYEDILTTCGFSDAEKPITTAEGGAFLRGDTAAKLEQLFELLQLQIEELFAQDRKAYEQMFDALDFDARSDAIIDLGWAGSSAKALSRFFETSDEQPLNAYYFGTWENATARSNEFVAHAYFMDRGRPSTHASLLSESINWIEALFSAPFQTLLKFKNSEGAMEPVYASDEVGGFSLEEQRLIWDGAEAFLHSATSFLNQPVQPKDGWTYLELTLKRLLREPSPQELETWGGLKHSEGFGREVYRPLITPLSPEAAPDEILSAYDASRWRRGFLSKITDDQAKFVLERRYAQPAKTYEEIRDENEWLKQQSDTMWAEKSALDAERKALKAKIQQVTRIHENDLKEVERLQKVIAEQAKAWEENQDEIERLEALSSKMQGENKRLLADLRKSNTVWEADQKEIKRLQEIIAERIEKQAGNQTETSPSMEPREKTTEI